MMNISSTSNRHSILRICQNAHLVKASQHGKQPTRSAYHYNISIQQVSGYRTSTPRILPPTKGKTAVDTSITSYSSIRYATTATSSRIALAEFQADITSLQNACQDILNVETIPEEDSILAIFSQAEALALRVLHPDLKPPPPSPTPKEDSAASALLAIQASSAPKPPIQASSTTRTIVDQVSTHTTSVLLFPPTFITPKILEAYVNLHYILQRPETLPTVLYLYANKPVAKLDSSPVSYSNQKKDAASNAVPLPVADRALQTAIDTKQLAIAMDIIGTSYATSASRKAKFIKRALLPTTGLAAAPIAAYAIATSFSMYQSTMDPQMATNIAFIGMLSYVGFTTTIGIIAITTANDQMERVTWAPGLPLRERWLREEERAAIDRIAVAWGFRQTWRRGEEEGEDWDTLREWIGRKGMILDRSSLLEGME